MKETENQLDKNSFEIFIMIKKAILLISILSYKEICLSRKNWWSNFSSFRGFDFSWTVILPFLCKIISFVLSLFMFKLISDFQYFS